MISVSGPRGKLCVGYQCAAVLGEWSLVPSNRFRTAFTFRAQLIEEHQYWGRQEPKDLVLALGCTEWVWRGVRVEREGSEVVIEITSKPLVTESTKGTGGKQ